MATSTDAGPKQVTHKYAQKNILQKASVYIPKPYTQEEAEKGFWLVYIHGGAWRDPTETLESFEPTQSLLLSSPEFASSASHILAIASIDYRLSPHPNFPQDPATTPETSLRNAKHPDHLQDVEMAIAFLQEKYNFGSRYVLVGHSCGGTLTFQAAMRPRSPFEGKIVRPIAIAGLAGIYDLRGLRDYRHGDLRPIYQDLLEVPFGPDEGLWDKVSPAKIRDTNRDTQGNWDEGRLIVLAHSANDELVEMGQAAVMKEGLVGWEGESKVGKRKITMILDLEESHEGIWKKGHEMARVIAATVDELHSLESAQ